MNMNMGIGSPESNVQSEPILRTLHDVLNNVEIEGDNFDFLPDVDIPEIGRVSVVEAVERGLYEEYLIMLQEVKEQDVEKERDAVDCLVSINEELKKESPDEAVILMAKTHFHQALLRN